MSKAIYYLGAGASYGKRDDGKKITEGIPVIAEIPEQFALFRDCIATTAIPTDGEMVFLQTYRTTASNIDSARRDMLYDIDQMLNGMQEHATIDSYARKLYLTGKKRVPSRSTLISSGREWPAALMMWLCRKSDTRLLRIARTVS